MTYFTSWEINVFLCLLEWGLPEDVVKGLTKMTKKVHEEFILEEARDYYLDREKWMPKTGYEKDKKFLKNRGGFERSIMDKRREINMRVISPIKTIPENFWIDSYSFHVSIYSFNL